jgi:hypothetical protein
LLVVRLHGLKVQAEKRSEIKFVGATPDFVLALNHTKHDLAV